METRTLSSFEYITDLIRVDYATHRLDYYTLQIAKIIEMAYHHPVHPPIKATAS